MLKITPIANNTLIKNLTKNKKNILLTSIISATVLSIVSLGGCSKLNKPIIQDRFEKQDTIKTQKKDSVLDIVIDTTYNTIYHEITL